MKKTFPHCHIVNRLKKVVTKRGHNQAAKHNLTWREPESITEEEYNTLLFCFCFFLANGKRRYIDFSLKILFNYLIILVFLQVARYNCEYCNLCLSWKLVTVNLEPSNFSFSVQSQFIASETNQTIQTKIVQNNL